MRMYNTKKEEKKLQNKKEWELKSVDDKTLCKFYSLFAFNIRQHLFFLSLPLPYILDKQGEREKKNYIQLWGK